MIFGQKRVKLSFLGQVVRGDLGCKTGSDAFREKPQYF